MIVLAAQTPIGEGAEKSVYRHPQNPLQVVKIIKDGYYANLRRRRPIRFFVRGKNYYNPVRREHRSYLEAVAAKSPALLLHIPKCYGIVASDKGECLVCEMLRRADGSPALNLGQYISAQECGVSPSLLAAIRAFLRAVRSPLWHDWDLAAKNILVSESQNGEIRLAHCEYKHYWRHTLQPQWWRQIKKENRLKKSFFPLLQKHGVNL